MDWKILLLTALAAFIGSIGQLEFKRGADNLQFDIKLLLYEHNAEKYFDSEWKPYYVVDRLVFSGRFMFEAVLGTYPRRVIIIRFLSNS